MPFGGKYQTTPAQAMAHKISVSDRNASTASLMAWGYNPMIAEKSPYHASYLAVVESVARLIASGASFREVYLTFQEYFEKPLRDPARWGKPLSALLGAFEAQMDLGIASIGGKDSMSGSFEKLDVPPTLVSFAVTVDPVSAVISPEFKAAGHKIALLDPETDGRGLPTPDSLILNFNAIRAGIDELGLKEALNRSVQAGLVAAVDYPDDPAFDFEKVHDYCYERGFTIYPGKMQNRGTFRLCALGAIDEQDIKDFWAVFKEALKDSGVSVPVKYN